MSCELLSAGRIALIHCLGLRTGERVAVITVVTSPTFWFDDLLVMQDSQLRI